MINILNHLEIYAPTLSQAEITFYGVVGYWMFGFLCITSISFQIIIIKKIMKIIKK